MQQILERSVVYVKGVGPKRAELFEKVGVSTVYDLLQYCPRDYIDLSAPCEIKNAQGEDPLVIRARVVKKMPPARIRKGLTVCKAVFTDDTDDITVTLYNQEYLFASLKEGEDYILYGKVAGNMVRREMNSPMVFSAASPDLILPVYPLTEGLSQNIIRKAVRGALDLVLGEVEDIMPQYVRDSCRMCSLACAWENIHFPKSLYGAHEARRRLIFDELLIHSLAIAYQRQNEDSDSNYIMQAQPLEEFTSALPFTLTKTQLRSLNDCTVAMRGAHRMNRLIQGDVGCGKTVVAAGAAWFAYKNGYQSCVMAPTEILAAQHYKTFKSLLEPLGVRVALLTGSLTPKNKRVLKEQIAAGEFDVIVGTHALFSESTHFSDLALVITDEQHRFGVEQRAALSAKGRNPHRLVMSATPIPRTLALILYGDLDISVINELPAGRKPISTYAVTGKMRERAFGFVKKQLEMGRQGYVVCPMIDESESDLNDVTSYSQKLAQGAFADYKVGLLHGRMSAAEKEEVMNGFKRGEIDLLVATTVVEVGVDVPNAAVMVIENADRFGLSQLHQLRGRVGRGEWESFCILITDNTSPECVQRMKIISRTSDGFKIAEEDLKLRGPGDFFGTHQHGLPAFKLADLTRDMQLLQTAQQMSKSIIESDPQLKRADHRIMRELTQRLMQRGAEMT
ncbi:ATP-dependent DNA helicase RecG [Ruminococcus sp. 210702-SL.1.03]|jgi:ATP-dependent DNA helicase RecG|uniref:ATP-dependent DNA helicase RecG n=1 Tax=Ruminococcus sp. 210702-SL.1.03 TaxID=2883233 RepID=UPI001D0817DD|nr:ATP-dependent DNA helicase RecG [Ruminococcus sp. 210702-SL.1.03]MCB6615620.1 ATP-dependent DNA helicase RecG [Ruminococcus sp. 210702-SL.1.03]